MPTVPFRTVDVFTAVPFKGNPVAVVLDASTLTAAQMQQIAQWMNLSETTFVVPTTDPQADYHVRVFTPKAELPFAGHPTLGTAHALLESGLIRAHQGGLRQQCRLGLINLLVEVSPDGSRWLSFELPKPRLSAMDAAQSQALVAILQAPLASDARPFVVDVGPRWLVAQLDSADAVIQATPDLVQMKRQSIDGHHSGVVIFGAHPPGSAAQIEVRAFAPAHGVDEDPVCGSGNGAVAAFIRATGQADRFGRQILATQGQVVGRAGRVRLSIEPDTIHVGGMAVTGVNGSLTI